MMRDQPPSDARAGTRTGASPDGLPPLREVIRTLGLTAKKSLGQNFILDLNLTRKIARTAARLEARTIVEIGPGPGGLTRALLMEGAQRVVAVERDRRVEPALDAIAAHYPGRLVVHYADALDTDWSSLLVPRPIETAIVANLPYGVATRLLVGWLETSPWPPWFAQMVLMFQKEVAERIVARPSTKAYGRLAVLAQWRCEPHLIMTLPPGAFSPPPKVESAVVSFVPRPDPQPDCDVRLLREVTAAAFGQRRKMLRQSLKSLVALPEVFLRDAGIDPQARAETLSVADFARLAQGLAAERAAGGAIGRLTRR